jgi:outer membrane protein TolC
LSAYAAERASEAKVRAARAEFKPKVFMSATGAYNSGHFDVTALPAVGQGSSTVNINNERVGATILAGITMPLFDGGLRSALLAQARNDADSAQAKLTETRQDAVVQIVQAENALRTSVAAYAAAQALQQASQTTFDGALASYRNGVGSTTDMTLAEIQLLQARNAASDSYSASLTAAASLALATGLLGSAPQD